MIPVLSSELAESIQPAIRLNIQTHHLYRYLNFTVLLESLVVNKTLLGIYLKTTGIIVNDAQRINALRMYTDEAYHALAAADMAQQVARFTGVPNTSASDLDAVFLRRLKSIQDAASSSSLAVLLELVFVIISETLISGTLKDVSYDKSVNSGIRDVINDHARDEGRHHAFFYKYLKELWANLTQAERLEVGRTAPALIRAFFAPEYESVEAELGTYGLPAPFIRDLLADAYAADRLDQSIRASSQNIVRYFEELGAFEVPETPKGWRWMN
jgi:hypothetical protein